MDASILQVTMKALVLAAGFGTRLKEIIHDRPKVMAPIDGRPFLEYVLGVLRKNGISEVVIAVGFLGDFIKDYFGDGWKFGLKIDYSEENYPHGTAGTIKTAEKFFKETFLVLNGDTYLDTDLSKVIEFHQKKKAWGTLILRRKKMVQGSGVVIKEKSGKIAAFLEKPSGGKKGLVNCGYYVFEPQIFSLIEEGKRISLEEKIFPLLVEKKVLYGREVREDFVDIGTPQNYDLAQKILSQRKRKTIRSWAPVRISFAGGGTDLPEYFLKEGGCVVSGTINKYAQVIIKITDSPQIRIILEDYQKEESYPLGKSLPYDGGIFDLYKAAINRLGFKEGVDIYVKGDFPAGSGLGSSSAITVAIVGALLKLKGQKLSKKKVAELAVEIEREILKIPGGWQDQYASSFGGLNFIEFLPGGKVRLTPLVLKGQAFQQLEKNLILFFLANRRSERSQQKYLQKQIRNTDEVNEHLVSLKRLAHKIRSTLERGQIIEFGNLLHQAWLTKKRLSGKVTTGGIDKIYDLAVRTGARGGKILGAGGGGCLLVCASPQKQTKIIKAIKTKGAHFLPFKFESEGLKVELYED